MNACTSTDNAGSSSLVTDQSSGSGEDSTSDSEGEGDSTTSAESSDEEGKSAIEAAMTGKEIAKPTESNKSNKSNKTNKSASTPVSSERDYLTSFPKTDSPEELQLLLAEHERLELESNKTCFNEISSITKNAKNSEALSSASNQITVLIKDQPSEYHWCFLANHHLLAIALASEVSMAEKIKHFHSSMISLVALAKGLDLSSNLNRYARYNRDRYIALSKEYFGRELSPIDSPNR
jgi:uncharacterized protein YegP (UPF0339 family)